ncbi:MAG: SusC/RagA family TonB-linked outer membrane protein [Chitinophagaceae bacterium]|nr:SusC/RagA family TonB-linked outer membrane protein [Chitinophagaceae bacterium]
MIIITTKRGKVGDVKIKVQRVCGWQDPVNHQMAQFMYEYAKLLNEGLKNEGATPRYSEEDLEKFRDGSDPVGHPNTDWNALFFAGSGFQQSHSIDFSGGNAKTRYFLSVGYLDQKGVVKKMANDRYNIRFNLDSRVSDMLSVGLNSSLSRQIRTEPSGFASNFGSILIHVNRVPPTEPVKYPDGTYTHYFEGAPVAWIDEGDVEKGVSSHVQTTAFAELTIIEGLKLNGSFGVDYNNLDQYRHLTDFLYGDGFYQGPNSVTNSLNQSMYTKPQLLLTYGKDFNRSKFNILLGTSHESYTVKGISAYRKDFPSNDLIGLSAGSLVGMSNSGSIIENTVISHFGRLNYSFDNRYLLEMNLRNDGSSKFAQDKRWGWFPSVSAGWRISEEEFMKDIQFINDFKLRASYGVVGNNATDDYQYINKISLGLNYPFGQTIVSGAAQTESSSPDLKWEMASSYDFGFDISLFNNQLSLTADYYNRYTDNILIRVPVSSIYGLPAPVTNGGAMRNKGFELRLNHRNQVSHQLSYSITGNFGINKNETVKFPNPSVGSKIYMEGVSWGAFYGYEYTGLYQTDDQVTKAPKVVGAPVQKGDLMFKDQNDDGVINGDDRIVLGSDIPRVSYGLNLSLNYRNFDLLIFGAGVAGVKQLLANNILFPFINGYKAMEADLDRWTPETPNARNPIIHVSQTHNYSTISSFMVRNSSYLRLRDMQIGYTFREVGFGKHRLNQIRIFLSGHNLVTFMDREFGNRGFDPEAPTGANSTYPIVKTFTGGININF